MVNAVQAQLELISKRLRDKYERQYGSPKKGLGRATFINDDYVIKVPMNARGIKENLQEYMASKHADVPVAKCSLRWVNGLPIVKMYRVDPIVEFNPQHACSGGDIPCDCIEKQRSLPDWARNIDCGQVGRDPRNPQLILAYDYAVLFDRW